ncbi:MAG: HAD-IA family hydrolase [bacterium]
MKNYNLLVFDWDGTLVDSSGLVVKSTQKAAMDLGYAIPEAEEVRKHFGLSLEAIHQQLFPEANYSVFSEAFHHHCNEEEPSDYFFAGAIETLTHLKECGFTLAVATNKQRSRLEIELNMVKIKNLFSATRSPDDCFPKPHPDMLTTLLDELMCEPKDALMIGDTTFDMQFAQNAKVDALAVCYGHHKKEQLAVFNPVGFIENIRDLKSIL